MGERSSGPSRAGPSDPSPHARPAPLVEESSNQHRQDAFRYKCAAARGGGPPMSLSWDTSWVLSTRCGSPDGDAAPGRAGRGRPRVGSTGRFVPGWRAAEPESLLPRSLSPMLRPSTSGRRHAAPTRHRERSAIGGALLYVRELGVEPAVVPVEVRRGVPTHAGRAGGAALPCVCPDGLLGQV